MVPGVRGERQADTWGKRAGREYCRFIQRQLVSQCAGAELMEDGGDAGRWAQEVSAGHCEDSSFCSESNGNHCTALCRPVTWSSDYTQGSTWLLQTDTSKTAIEAVAEWIQSSGEKENRCLYQGVTSMMRDAGCAQKGSLSNRGEEKPKFKSCHLPATKSKGENRK